MKHILLFGAGKSATALIHYLISEAPANKWHIKICDSDAAIARSKAGESTHATVIAADVRNEEERSPLVQSADIVISLLPPNLHFLVARDCLRFGRNLLTASYIDPNIQDLSEEIRRKGLLFLCEMGLDPGIDHMSAMKLINKIRSQGGSIDTFRSHCGGLIAPESDDNPWRYKISWNPRNIVLAGKAGADFRDRGNNTHYSYEVLFDPERLVTIPALGDLSWYPNRDSLNYVPVYKLESANTFVRTTLRYPEFCFGWKNLIDLKLTDETIQYETDGMSLLEFFQQHFKKYGFSNWIEKQLTSRFTQTKALLEKLQQLLEAEEEASISEHKDMQEFMAVDDKGELMDINLDEVKTNATATAAGTMHEANLAIKQLYFLGMNDEELIINKGKCSAADVLQFALERKLALKESDRDMIVMLHEIGFTKDGKKHTARSSLIEKGMDHQRTAMAKTVGLPLGIAAKLILQEKISLKGLHIPVSQEIYEPVLAELEKMGIQFEETIL